MNDSYAAGLDLLPCPCSIFDVHGNVLFSNWASTKFGPVNIAKECLNKRQVSESQDPLVPVCTWTEREYRGCSDGEARILSCNAFVNEGSRESGPVRFIVLRHDITYLCKRHQVVELEAALLRSSLLEAQEHNKRLHGSAKEMADSVAELRNLLNTSSKQQHLLPQQGGGTFLQWSPANASHIFAMMASFDACLRRFRYMSTMEKQATPSNSRGKGIPHCNSHVLSNTDSPRTTCSASLMPAHFVAAAVGSGGGTGMPQQNGSSGSANSKQHSSGNQRRFKQQQHQLHSSSMGADVPSLGGSSHFAALSGSSNCTLGHMQRFNSGPELLGEEEKHERGGGGCRGVNKSSHQLSARVLQLQEQLAQLQSKHNAVCVHAAELAQENQALRQHLSQALSDAPPQQQPLLLQGPCLSAPTSCSPWDVLPGPCLSAPTARSPCDMHSPLQQQQQQQQQQDRAICMRRVQSFPQELVALWVKDRAQAATADSTAMGSACALGHEKCVLAAKQAFDIQLHKAQQEATQLKADYDTLIQGANEGQQGCCAQPHKMQVDTHLSKAVRDKGDVDTDEQRRQLDAELSKAREHILELQALVEKGKIAAAEQKQEFDAQLLKAMADAAEFKAIHDKGEHDAVEQKQQLDAQLHKATTDAAEFKAMYDKGELDAVEQKQQLDAQLLKANTDAAEFKAMHDKGKLDAIEQKQQFDAQLLKANTDASEFKAMYDKGELDAVEQKQQFDAQLHKATTDAAEFKAMCDKGELDAVEQKQQFDAQLHKANTDAAEFKAMYDKLQKANTDAAEFKAMYDKGELDAVEQKQQLDAHLHKITTDAAEFKAMYDKGEHDAVEQKQHFDAQLHKANTDAAEFKAMYDKGEHDAVEQKQQFDAQLQKANTDAAEFKAMYDKGELDAVEQKQQLDAQLHKVTTDAAEFKAMYDKGKLDAVEQKQQFDAQLLKANTDATEYKAQFDKGEEEAQQQRLMLDAQVAEAKARAQELKAMLDKGELDAAAAKELHEKQVRELCAQNNSLGMQAARDKLLAEFTKEMLSREQQELSQLQSEHQCLLRKQEVLQEELQMALNNYQPKAVIDAGTPADKMLTMMAELLDGMVPSIQDILFVQSAVLESLDIYQPVNLGKQLLHGTDLEEEVGMALLHQLGGNVNAQQPAASNKEISSPLTLKDFSELHRRSRHRSSESSKSCYLSSNLYEVTCNEEMDFGNLEQGLLLIMSPGFDGESQQPASNALYASSCAGSESSPPASTKSAFSAPPTAGCTAPSPFASIPISTNHIIGPGGNNTSLASNHSSSISGSSLANPANPFSTMSGVQRRCMRCPPSPSATSNSLLLASTAHQPNSPQVALPHVLAVPEERSRYANGQSRTRLSLQMEPESLQQCELQRQQHQQEADEALQECQDFSRQSSDQMTTFTAEEADHFPSPSSGPIIGDVTAVLSSASHWQFDSFKLNDVTNGHPLSSLAFYLFHTEGLIEHLSLKPAHLARFLRHVEEGYRSNPYHNKIHAADVLQTMHAILKRGGMLPGYADPLTHMACLLAAVIHDYEHMGCTNDFLINKCDDLAMRYNDRAPLENHHLAAAFLLLKQSSYNFLSSIPKHSFDRLRKLVIELVLATDMKQHFAIVSHFTTIHRLSSSPSLTPSLPSLKECTRGRQSESGYSSAGHRSLNSGDPGAPDQHIILPLDEAERLLSLQVALKCCDLGHTASALPVHLRWVAALEEEFFRQGDAERAAGMTISPLFDRNKQGISKSQVGFYDIVVIPLFHAFARVFPGCRPLLTYVMRNYKVWTEQGTGSSSNGSQLSRSGSQVASPPGV